MAPNNSALIALERRTIRFLIVLRPMTKESARRGPCPIPPNFLPAHAFTTFRARPCRWWSANSQGSRLAVTCAKDGPLEMIDRVISFESSRDETE
jgi:hypothetical protein